MTEPDAADVLHATVEVDYGQWNLFDPEAVQDAVAGRIGEPYSDAELWEQRCASSGWGAIVYTLKQYGTTEVMVRSVSSPPALDAGADHVAECSVIARSGRLAVSGWESSTIAGVLRVPDEALRLRIGWFGLTRELETDDEAHERFAIDVFPGPAGPVEVLRWWPTWIPPVHESTTEHGLRRFTGPRAEQARTTLEWIPLLFWPPYPEMPDGAVTSLWRDAGDGSRWAHGPGMGGHQVLRELTLDESRDLEAQGFESVRTYAIDAEGRIWTSDVMPLERVPCLNLVPRWQFEMVTGMTGGLVGVNVVDLPPGWGRLVRRPREGGGGPVEIAAIDDADDGFYQRWRDDQPAPTS